MDYQTLQQKLDCFALTAKISRSRTREIEAVGNISYDCKLSDEILSNILTQKRAEDRILTRLDYWIYGHLTEKDSEICFNGHEDTACYRQKETTQIWDFNIDGRKGKEIQSSYEHSNPIKEEISQGSSPVATARTNRRKPLKNEKRLQRDSISMFAYNSKSRLDVDEGLPTGAILRKSMFSKFGTLSSRKMKTFFRKENSDEHDETKSRKSLKSENILRSSTNADKSKGFFSTFRKKEKLDSTIETNLNKKIHIGNENRSKKRRPKSVASHDFDLDDFEFPQTNFENVKRNLPEDYESKGKTFRERLRTMPVFYVPLSNKGPLKVFK